MNGLLAYSGITTKVRAMEGHLISDSQFQNMAALERVSDAVDFLKQLPSYQTVLANLESDQLHRGMIEQCLTLSQYHDFAKLYRFSNPSQRKFLDLYFMHYEIAILKKCLRNVLDRKKFQLNLFVFQKFFDRHSKLDLIRLSTAENLDDFVANLHGSPYYEPLLKLSEESSDVSLFDYEMHLDLMYFKVMWKIKDKLLSKKEREILTQCFGSKLDMLNIQWIYRSKKYYNLSSTDIYALLIPVQHRLKNDDIMKMAEAGNLDEFYQALHGTFYGSLELTDLNEKPDLEELYEKVLNRIHRLTSKRQPYSIATLNSYLYFKELEIRKIITVIEGIRYDLGAATICSYIMKN
ncbi:MAG: V0D/AC39 family V-type ATPase subunit [Hungatella sp.]